MTTLIDCLTVSSVLMDDDLNDKIICDTVAKLKDVYTLMCE